jgi:hypothetical protein
MRRCELAGARRDLLDLAAGTLEIDVTRVVVDGQVIESDGKTENAQHLMALDPFTLAALKAHVEMLDRERKDHGPDYRDHGVLFCWEDGTMHSLPGSRLRRPPLQPSEFVPPACFDSIAGPRVAPDHSAHIPDHDRPGPPASRFQAWHIPSWRAMCARPALSPVAAACRWSLLSLSSLLSGATSGRVAGRDQTVRVVREPHPGQGAA